MKFELKPLHKRYTDDDLLCDLCRVAAIVGRDYVLKSDYKIHGKYSRHTFRERFGSWRNAHEKAGLNAHALDPVKREDLLADLRRVASLLGKDSISIVEYNKNGHWSVSPFVRIFGGWLQALKAASLKNHPQAKLRIPDEELFANIERVWTTIGRQPRYQEMAPPLSNYSKGTYAKRFATWRRALEAFVAWANEDVSNPSAAMGNSATPSIVETTAMTSMANKTPRAIIRTHQRTPREINLRLRFRVLQRDRFTCCACGRSPASVLGLVLHVDHIVPWSKGGKTVMENLQTLCSACNLGKSDEHPG